MCVWNVAARRKVFVLLSVCVVDAFVFVSQGACCVNTERLENGDKSFYTRADDALTVFLAVAAKWDVRKAASLFCQRGG